MISDIDNNSASPARTNAASAYSRKGTMVKARAGLTVPSGPAIEIVRSIDPYDGRRIFMRIGKPGIRPAVAVPRIILTPAAERLVSGRSGLPSLDDIFTPTGRTSASGKNKEWL